jgi:probable HAF family extracellular repeat protein
MNRLLLSLTVLLALSNAAGTVLGAMYDILDLGTLGGTRSEAYGINASGQVVGWSLVPGVSPGGHAFRTAANQPINPATDDLGGGNTSAAGINDSGQVVGIVTVHAPASNDGADW